MGDKNRCNPRQLENSVCSVEEATADGVAAWQRANAGIARPSTGVQLAPRDCAREEGEEEHITYLESHRRELHA